MEAYVRNVCNRNVVTLSPTATVAEAAALMRKHHVGTVVIVEPQGTQEKPVGIVTDRDIVVEVIAAGVDPGKFTIGEITRRPLITLAADANASHAVREMATNGVRRMPVVDARGALIGIVSLDDVLVDLIAPLVAISDLAARERRFEASTRAA